MQYNQTNDPIRVFVEALGSKWRLVVLKALFEDRSRFKDLLDNIIGITPKMLSKELKVLESFGYVEKEVFKEKPPRVEYNITDNGIKLFPLIETLVEVGERLSLDEIVQQALKAKPIRHSKKRKPKPKIDNSDKYNEDGTPKFIKIPIKTNNNELPLVQKSLKKIKREEEVKERKTPKYKQLELF